jgi:hypothetical protein
MSDEELELRPVYISGELVYVNRFGDLWRWKKSRWGYITFIKIVVKLHDGYKCPEISKKEYKQHRIIATAFLGLDINNTKIQVDHINGVRHDNRLENLRLVTHQQNQHNRTKAKGYTWNKLRNKWQSQIRINSKKKHLGYFELEEEAHKAYLEAKLIYHKI